VEEVERQALVGHLQGTVGPGDGGQLPGHPGASLHGRPGRHRERWPNRQTLARTIADAGGVVGECVEGHLVRCVNQKGAVSAIGPGHHSWRRRRTRCGSGGARRRGPTGRYQHGRQGAHQKGAATLGNSHFCLQTSIPEHRAKCPDVPDV